METEQELANIKVPSIETVLLALILEADKAPEVTDLDLILKLYPNFTLPNIDNVLFINVLLLIKTLPPIIMLFLTVKLDPILAKEVALKVLDIKILPWTLVKEDILILEHRENVELMKL